MNKTSATVVADSINPQGDRLTSLLITFPRILLSEINTHRMLSKNTSSSRAIPFHKMVKTVHENPFIPIAWQKHHSGMQGNEYHTGKGNVGDINYKARAERNWLRARDFAVEQAKYLYEDSLVTKQLCNRLLEPFMWTTMLITGSREGWNNFFSLRCPNYDGFKSKKEASKEFLEKGNINTSTWSELDWLQLNKGQAEIHIMDLAEKIYDAVNESTPKQLKADQWHIPMISDLESLKLSTDDQIKLSVGRAANTSYTVVGDGKKLTLEQAVRIHDKCKELNHSSVFEHCARAMSDEEYYSFIKGNFNQEIEIDADGFIDISTHSNNSNSFGWCNNLKGFIPYRYFIDNNLI